MLEQRMITHRGHAGEMETKRSDMWTRGLIVGPMSVQKKVMRLRQAHQTWCRGRPLPLDLYAWSYVGMGTMIRSYGVLNFHLTILHFSSLLSDAETLCWHVLWIPPSWIIGNYVWSNGCALLLYKNKTRGCYGDRGLHLEQKREN